jgi:Ca-activated chloride channel homolog
VKALLALAATLVAGGATPDRAPVLEPGAYTDTIVPGEQRFWAVRVRAGQRLTARLAVDGTQSERGPGGIAGGVSGLGGALLTTPLGEPLYPAALFADAELDGVVRAEVAAEAQDVPAADRAAAGFEPWRGPGLWFVSVFQGVGDRTGARVELPVALELEVEGTPRDAGGPVPVRGRGGDPLGLPGAPPAEVRPPTPPDERRADLLGAGAGLVAGAAAALVLLRRRRRA